MPNNTHPYKRLNYLYKNRNFVKLYKPDPKNDRFNEAALSLRATGYEQLNLKGKFRKRNFFRKLEMAFCGIFLLIPRLVGIFIFFLPILFFSSLAVIGLPRQETPYLEPKVNGWRRNCQILSCTFFRIIYFFMGIYYVNEVEVGKKASSQEAPIRVYAPHTGFYDSVLHTIFPVYKNLLCPVVSYELSKSFIFDKFWRAFMDD